MDDRQKKHISVASHTDVDRTVTPTTLPSTCPLLPRSGLMDYSLCKKRNGHFLPIHTVHQSLPGQVHVTSQRKQTLTIIGIYRQSKKFAGRNKEATL